MKLKHNKNGTFDLTGLTLDELSMAFYPHNVAPFTDALEGKMKTASDAIFMCLTDTPAYRGIEYNEKVFNAMKCCYNPPRKLS